MKDKIIPITIILIVLALITMGMIVAFGGI